MKSILKIIFVPLGYIWSVGILLFLVVGVGSFIASTVQEGNQGVIILSYAFLWVLFGYLIVQAEIQGNDGIGPGGVALMSGWIYAAIATKIIFSVLSLGPTFAAVIISIFLFLVVSMAVWFQHRDQKERVKSHRAWAADWTLSIFSSAGLISGLLAYGFYKLELFTK